MPAALMLLSMIPRVPADLQAAQPHPIGPGWYLILIALAVYFFFVLGGSAVLRRRRRPPPSA